MEEEQSTSEERSDKAIKDLARSGEDEPLEEQLTGTRPGLTSLWGGPTSAEGVL